LRLDEILWDDIDLKAIQKEALSPKQCFGRADNARRADFERFVWVHGRGYEI
jgi:hypothetical protein